MFWFLILNVSQTCICDNEMLLSQPCSWYHASTRSRRAQHSQDSWYHASTKSRRAQHGQDYVSSHWLLLLCQYLTSNQLTPIWWNPDFTICIWLSPATWQFLFVWYLFLFFNVKLFFLFLFFFFFFFFEFNNFASNMTNEIFLLVPLIYISSFWRLLMAF